MPEDPAPDPPQLPDGGDGPPPAPVRTRVFRAGLWSVVGGAFSLLLVALAVSGAGVWALALALLIALLGGVAGLTAAVRNRSRALGILGTALCTTALLATPLLLR